MTTDQLAATRRGLHGVAELLIAGPQYRELGTIRLAVSTRGFGGARLSISVEGDELVWPGGRTRLEGTIADIAKRAGIEPAGAEDVYHDTSGVDLHEELVIDRACADELAGVMWLGDLGLRSFAPDQTAVLWPEHFDLGITLDEVNYGISPGDAGCAEPYAYVGPWDFADNPRSGDFWNAGFGASRPISQLGSPNAIAAFFREGQKLAQG